MKLAYVLDGFPHPSETFILREIAEAARRFDVTIVVLTAADPAVPVPPEAAALAPRVVRLPDVPASSLGALGHGLAHPRRYARALAAARRAREEGTLRRFPRLVAVGERLRREGVDRIHAHFARWATAAAEVLSAWTGAPFGFTAHAYDVFAQPVRLPEKARAASWRVVCSDAAFGAVLVELGPGEPAASVRVIRHGVDLDAWSPAAGKTSTGRLRVTAAGNFVAKKGFDVLLDAAALLGERGAPVDVRIFGDGPLEASLRARPAAATVLRPRVPAEEMRRVLREETDVLAFPARRARDGDRDGLPNVVGEAMACGVPVVGTDVGGLGDMLRNGETGIVVPEGDAEALSWALERLAGDAELRGRLGRGARAKAETTFDAKKNLDALFALIEKGG